jgi:transcription elongation factor SPT5
MGVVEYVEEDTITVRPLHEELKDLLHFRPHQLRKYFKMGDHVKVVSGKFQGETGLIVRVLDNSVVIFSDVTKKEIEVITPSLRI